MSRPLRIEFPGALYHLTSRGDGREAIYRETADRLVFLEVLGEVCARFNGACHAYCLMGNHHLWQFSGMQVGCARISCLAAIQNRCLSVVFLALPFPESVRLPVVRVVLFAPAMSVQVILPAWTCERVAACQLRR